VIVIFLSSLPKRPTIVDEGVVKALVCVTTDCSFEDTMVVVVAHYIGGCGACG
jgi:hypothetical protein